MSFQQIATHRAMLLVKRHHHISTFALVALRTTWHHISMNAALCGSWFMKQPLPEPTILLLYNYFNHFLGWLCLHFLAMFTVEKLKNQLVVNYGFETTMRATAFY